MSDELVKNQRAILMKSGIALWVSEMTGAKVETILAEQEGHRFIKISELGQTINTAQVEGVYTPDKYDQIQRVKRGEWQCGYRNWHDRRERCECSKEIARVQSVTEQEKYLKEIDREIGPAEQARIEKKKKEIRADLEKVGVLKKIGGGQKAYYTEEGIAEYEKSTGVKWKGPRPLKA